MCGVGPGGGDGILGEVIAHEPAVGEHLSQAVHGHAAAAADVKHVDAALQLLAKSGHERDDAVLEARHCGLAALLGHDRVKPLVGGIGHAPAVPEGLDDLVFHRPEHADPLRHRCQVVRNRPAGQESGMLGGQDESPGLGMVLDDSARDHRPEPFANVAFAEARACGDFLAGCRRHVRHGVEQTGAVSDGDHQGQPGVVQDAQHPLVEAAGPSGHLQRCLRVCCHVSVPRVMGVSVSGGPSARPDRLAKCKIVAPADRPDKRLILKCNQLSLIPSW